MSREISQFLRGRHGEAIEESYRFCMRPVLSNIDELLDLAKYLQCTRLEAAEFYAKMCEKTFPYAYPRMAQVELRPAGAPSPGLPFDLDDVREIIDIPDDEPVEVREIANIADDEPGETPELVGPVE